MWQTKSFSTKRCHSKGDEKQEEKEKEVEVEEKEMKQIKTR